MPCDARELLAVVEDEQSPSGSSQRGQTIQRAASGGLHGKADGLRGGRREERGVGKRADVDDAGPPGESLSEPLGGFSGQA